MAAKRNLLKNKKASASSGLFRPTYFNVKIMMDQTSEVFPMKLYSELSIKELKSKLEFLVGIPNHMQRLWYLDVADLQDNTDVKQNHIMPDGIIHITVRHNWCNIIDAVIQNDMETLFTLGVTKTSDYTTPNIAYLARWNPKGKIEYMEERSFLALFLATSRGRLEIVKKLLATGANVNGCTKFGRTPLHVGAAQGHGEVMDLLMEKGAKIDAKDIFGDTPSSIAVKYGHKDCDRHLFMFRWQQRAKKTFSKKKAKTKKV